MAKNYIDDEKLYAAMVEYIAEYNEAKAAGKETPRCTPYIGECIWLIANNLATTKNFVNYTYKEDMIGDGIENTLRYLHNFDPVKFKKPFAYFTQIIYYAFLRRIEKEKKETYVKYKVTEEAISTNNLVTMHPDDASHFQAHVNTLDYDKLVSLYDKFEAKKDKKKKKAGIEIFIDEEPQGDNDDGTL